MARSTNRARCFISSACVRHHLGARVFKRGKQKFEEAQALKEQQRKEKKEDREYDVKLLSEAVDSLKNQLEEQSKSHREEIAELRKEIAELRDERDYNGELRHAIRDQNQALLFHCEVVLQIVREMSVVWKEMPDYFAQRIAQLKSPREILQNYPLPERRKQGN